MSNTYYIDYIWVNWSVNRQRFWSFDEAEEFAEKVYNLDYTLYTHTDQNIPIIIKKHKAEKLQYVITFQHNNWNDIKYFCRYNKCIEFWRSLGNRDWKIYNMEKLNLLVKHKKRLDFI